VDVSGSTTTKRVWYESVPYILNFELQLYGSNQEEVFQMVEQIVPWFTPDYTVKVEDFEFDGSNTDVPLKLTGVSPVSEYEGDFVSRESWTAVLNLDMKVRFSKPSTTPKIIRKSDIDYFNLDETKFFEEQGAYLDSQDSQQTWIDNSDDDSETL